MSGHFKTIKISKIDISDQRYNIFSPFTQAQPFLSDSLKELGMIVPPIVKLITGPETRDKKHDSVRRQDSENSNGMKNRYIIISGFNRIRALDTNKIQEVTVQIKDENIKDYECLCIAIADLAFRRPLSNAELILAIVRLSFFFDKGEILKKAPAVFNTRLKEHYIEELLAISALPEPALVLIDKGNLTLKAAKKLCALEKEAAKVFLSLFSHIKVSLNIQMEMIRNMFEIAAYEGISIQALYETMGIQKLFEDENIDRISTARKLRRMIYERRYPALCMVQQTVKNKISALNLPETIKITPSENFESREFNISLTINKANDPDKNIAALTDPILNSKLKDIFSL
jgi:hypothetical protein